MIIPPQRLLHAIEPVAIRMKNYRTAIELLQKHSRPEDFGVKVAMLELLENEMRPSRWWAWVFVPLMATTVLIYEAVLEGVVQGVVIERARPWLCEKGVFDCPVDPDSVRPAQQ